LEGGEIVKILWMIPVVLLGIAWWMRKASNAKAKRS
jgi:hypothetical protein